MKKVCIALSCLLLFLHTSILTFAQEATPTAVPVAQTADNSSDSQDQAAFTVCPPQTTSDNTTSSNPCPPDPTGDYISDFTPSVKISFPNLDPSGDIKLCFRTDHCVGNWGIQQLSTDRWRQVATQAGFKPSDMDETRLDDNKSDAKGSSTIIGGGNSIVVCGRGNNDLYYGSDCDPKNNHYFHAGNFYLVTVYQKSGNYVEVASGGFYVNHGAPKLEIMPVPNLAPGAHFKVLLSQSIIRQGGNNRNNYEVVLSGPGFGGDGTKNECDHIDSPNQPREFDFPLASDSHYVKADSPELNKTGYTLAGRYQFQINEQDNEGTDDCSGGYRYYTETCTINNNATLAKCQPPTIDPRGDDGRQLLALINMINGTNTIGSPLPCNKLTPTVGNPLDCDSIDTAIGPIALNPIGFVTRLFSIVLAFAGIGALILIIFSGYRLLLSRGNKEIIQGARETLTAAIVGLLFIIFSLVILSVIAGDILKIPGFG